MSFLDDLYAQSKTEVGGALATSMSNVASTLVSNQIQNMFKINQPSKSVIHTSAPAPSAPSIMSDPKVLWIAGGVGVLVLVLLLRR